MSKKAFEKIKAGLEEALALSRSTPFPLGGRFMRVSNPATTSPYGGKLSEYLSQSRRGFPDTFVVFLDPNAAGEPTDMHAFTVHWAHPWDSQRRTILCLLRDFGRVPLYGVLVRALYKE